MTIVVPAVDFEAAGLPHYPGELSVASFAAPAEQVKVEVGQVHAAGLAQREPATVAELAQEAPAAVG